MFYRYLNLGGPVMWPLLICSILLLAILFERAITLGIVRGLLRRKLSFRHVQAHRKVLPFFVDVPPALGLLGTVVGLVQSFALLDGAPDASGVGAGLATACITTIFGLIIALIASTSNYLLEAIVPPTSAPAASGLADAEPKAKQAGAETPAEHVSKSTARSSTTPAPQPAPA